MTSQTVKIGKREYVLLAKRDFDKLTAQAGRQTEDDYWTETALNAEAQARSTGEEPIAFSVVERELDAGKRTKRAERKSRR